MQHPDPIEDDMSVYLPEADGLSVIFGCAHAGSINTLNHILRQTGKMPIDTLIGGLHLIAASPERMDRTIAALRDLTPRRMGFCHCTGAPALRRIWNEFTDSCMDIHVGSRLSLAP